MPARPNLRFVLDRNGVPVAPEGGQKGARRGPEGGQKGPEFGLFWATPKGSEIPVMAMD